MAPPAGLEDLPAVDIGALIGRWHILETNFPMWLSGRRREPSFNYAAGERPDELLDVVRFRDRRGRVREIVGVDRQDPARPAHFRWRGRGLLAILRSDWYLVHLDAEAGVAAIYFTATLFTPEGLDIVARARDPAPEKLEAARAASRARDIVAPQVETLVALPR